MVEIRSRGKNSFGDATASHPAPRALEVAGRRIYSLFYARRRFVALAAYAGVAGFAYLVAFLLRFELTWPVEYTPVVAWSLPLLVLIRVVTDALFKLSSERWRFVGTEDVFRLLAATTTGSVIFFIATQAFAAPPLVPRSVILLEWMLSSYLTGGMWIAYRTSFEQIRLFRAGQKGVRRVLIVGAGEAGALLGREIRRSPTGYRAIGFVDDDPSKWGTRVSGIQVLGPPREIPRLSAAHDIEEIILAIPSAAPENVRRIVEEAERAHLPFKVLPGIASVLQGHVGLHQLRDVRLEDLLGRPLIQLELPELAADLRGRVVLITGAAGSIGSELSRQVALHEPSRLVLFDQSETGLFYVERELRDEFPTLDLVPIVGSIVDAAAVERVFNLHTPDRVFHAAAYKHVPMMEANAAEAVRNNVIGTWRIADAAGRHGVGKFVLVSTDKAVRPVSVMGATKRLAELIVLELQARHPATSYGGVRFGNVLGSNGSVVSIFQRQLAEGEPLTVTHPEATRYFMMIPEAVQLILQASLLPDLRGHIAMLEMGEPVPIVELARNLIRLSGGYHRDNGVVFTGLRAGERLHEELIAPDESTVQTAIPKVRRVLTPPVAADTWCRTARRWEEQLARGEDGRVLDELKREFPGLRLGPQALQRSTAISPAAS